METTIELSTEMNSWTNNEPAMMWPSEAATSPLPYETMKQAIAAEVGPALFAPNRTRRVTMIEVAEVSAAWPVEPPTQVLPVETMAQAMTAGF